MTGYKFWHPEHRALTIVRKLLFCFLPFLDRIHSIKCQGPGILRGLGSVPYEHLPSLYIKQNEWWSTTETWYLGLDFNKAHFVSFLMSNAVEPPKSLRVGFFFLTFSNVYNHLTLEEIHKRRWFFALKYANLEKSKN